MQFPSAVKRVYARLSAALLYLVVLFSSLFWQGTAWAAAGDLDPSFDGDGRVITSFLGSTSGVTSEKANAVAVQSDGKIVVAGVGADNFALMRFNANGSADDTFGFDGAAYTPFEGGSTANSVALQSDGK